MPAYQSLWLMSLLLLLLLLFLMLLNSTVKGREKPPPPLVRGLPKVIFLAVVKAKGKGEKTSALEVEAKGEAKVLVFNI